MRVFTLFLAFSFSFKVVRTRSWSLPMPAPGNVLVWVLLMLDFKRWGVNLVVDLAVRGMPGGGQRRLVGVWRVDQGEAVTSGELQQSETAVVGMSSADFPTVPAHSSKACGPTLAFQSPSTISMSFLAASAMVLSRSS